MRISKWVDGLARPTFAPAYWGIATHSRRSEKAHVLPPSSVSMDAYCHYALPPLEQVPGTRLGVVELGDGRGAVLCPQRGQCLTGPVAGPRPTPCGSSCGNSATKFPPSEERTAKRWSSRPALPPCWHGC